jgi:hypothetical protein
MDDGDVTEPSPAAEHWDEEYRLGDATRSWFQPTATQSLRMLDAAGVTVADSVVDIGGGASRLVDGLVARGFKDVTVVDISAEAVHVAQDRLGELAGRVRWLVREVLTWQPQRTWRCWHDRAALHFFTTPTARDAYLRCLHAATTTGSIAVIATFAPDGPEHCSGLPVARYDARQLAELLGYAWQLVAVDRELHTTPAGTVQPFTWTTSRRTR